MRHFFTLLFIISCFYTHAQVTFQRIYQSLNLAEIGYGYCISTDGNYMIAGTTTNAFNGEACLMKVGPSGNVLWRKEYSGGDSLDQFNSIVKTFDGGYAMAGQAHEQHMCLLKTDSSGNVQWFREFVHTNSNDWSTHIIQDFDGGFILTGRGYEYGRIIKTDSTGNQVWDLSISPVNPYPLYLSHVSHTNDGGTIVTGINIINNQTRLLLLKLDSYGQIMWTRSYGNNFSGNVSFQTSDGGYITSGFGSSPNIQSGYVLLKSDSLGNLQWCKVYSDATFSPDLIVNADGDYIMAGTHSDGIVDSANIYLIKTNPLGDTIWTRFYEIDTTLGYRGESTNGIIQTPDGGYIVGANAFEQIQTAKIDLYLLKTDADGYAGCNQVNRQIIIQSITPPVDSSLFYFIGVTSFTWVPPANNFPISDTVLCIVDLINEYEHQLPFEVYPNPSSGFMNIHVPRSSSDELTIEMSDLMGREILQQKITPGTREVIDVSAFSKGVYIVRISGKNESGIQYFCKQ